MRIVPLAEVFRVRYGLSPVNVMKHNKMYVDVIKHSFRKCNNFLCPVDTY